MIEIDGSFGEGGGQVLRSSLTLSMLTGTPVRVRNIRAGRSKNGLLRQHLTCVNAAATLCDARVDGASMRSTELTFEPGDVRSGTHTFSVGTAGSSVLVAQTVTLPLMLRGGGESVITFEGGTHNPMAPTVDYYHDVWLPLLIRMGAVASMERQRYGFFPSGGGRWTLTTTGGQTLRELQLRERGPLTPRARLVLQDPSGNLSNIQPDALTRSLGTEDIKLRTLRGPDEAFVVTVLATSEHATEAFTALGTRRCRPSAVIDEACAEYWAYEASGAPVGEHLADQLLLPMAFGQGGTFSTMTPTLHTTTNAAIIEKFGVADVRIEQENKHRAQITVTPH